MNARDTYAGRQRLYRDPSHGIVCGVCAGVSDYFGFNLSVVRILAALSLIFFTPVTLLVYFVLCMMLPRRPDVLYRDPEEAGFWRDVRRDASTTFSDLRFRFRDLERRLEGLEAYVTSKRYDLDREFRDLEDR
ncbi:MAG: envelope stress response membrane protein PspC [Gammaproteobacteria bacterium]|jgi:phage shock protein C